MNLIETRPKLDDKVEQKIRKHLNLVTFGQSVMEESEEESNDLEGQRFTDNNNSIKKNSPFTKHFKEINDRVRSIISETESIDCELNDYYNPQLIDLLMEKFLPYSFIWTGYVFKCLENADVPRMSNGCIEVLFGYRKKVFLFL